MLRHWPKDDRKERKRYGIYRIISVRRGAGNGCFCGFHLQRSENEKSKFAYYYNTKYSITESNLINGVNTIAGFNSRYKY